MINISLEKRRTSSIKHFLLNNKIITLTGAVFLISTMLNLVLIYSFVKILTNSPI